MKDDRFYLVHILECIRNIEDDTAGGKPSLLGNRTFRDAVMRNLHLLAESSKRVSDPFKAAHPEIPWKPVARFRNVAVHDYFEIDYDEIWNIIAEDLPPLKAQISRIVGDPTPHS